MFPMVAFRVPTRKDHSLSFVVFISGKRQKGTTVCELLDEVRSTRHHPEFCVQVGSK